MRFFKELASSGSRRQYVEDYFSTQLYTGNGAARTIANGVDMTRSGMVLTRQRTGSTAAMAADTANGVGQSMPTNAFSLLQSTGSPTAWAANGYSIDGHEAYNQAGIDYASWAFRRARKFFDVVQFVGDGTNDQRVPHGLGVAPGMMWVRPVSSSNVFTVYSKGMGRHSRCTTHSAAAWVSNTNAWGTVEPTSTEFAVSATFLGLSSGSVCIAYLFADSPGADGMIASDILTTDASGSGFAALGWRPSFALIKAATGTSNWELFDTARGWTAGSQRIVTLNNASQESNTAANIVRSDESGLRVSGGWANMKVIYLAVRAGPMKP